MENFLEKLQEDLEKKMLPIINGESIVKPFNQVYEEVRARKGVKKSKTKIYDEESQSIYSEIIQSFLKDHPELVST